MSDWLTGRGIGRELEAAAAKRRDRRRDLARALSAMRHTAHYKALRGAWLRLRREARAQGSDVL